MWFSLNCDLIYEVIGCTEIYLCISRVFSGPNSTSVHLVFGSVLHSTVACSQVQWMWTAFTWKLSSSCGWTLDYWDFWMYWWYRKLWVPFLSNLRTIEISEVSYKEVNNWSIALLFKWCWKLFCYYFSDLIIQNMKMCCIFKIIIFGLDARLAMLVWLTGSWYHY